MRLWENISNAVTRPMHVFKKKYKAKKRTFGTNVLKSLSLQVSVHECASNYSFDGISFK